MYAKKYIILLYAILNMATIAHADPLSPEKAFQFIGKVENNKIIIYGTVQPNYKLYKESLKITNNTSQVQLGGLIKPQAKKQFNKTLNKFQEEYEGDFLLEIPIIGSKTNKGKIDFDIEAQGCTEGLCYSPFSTHIKLLK